MVPGRTQSHPFSPPPGQEAGGAHYGEGLPYPYYIGLSRHRDIDVHNHFKLDDGAGNIPMNWRFYPPLREQILEKMTIPAPWSMAMAPR